MKTKALLLSLFSIAFFSPVGLVIGQEEKKDAAKAEIERRRELERKTLILLDEIVAGASGLRLTENRIFVQVSAANLLWDRDEKRARGIFWEALKGSSLPRTLLLIHLSHLPEHERIVKSQIFKCVVASRRAPMAGAHVGL